jgi:hypothetical protein
LSTVRVDRANRYDAQIAFSAFLYAGGLLILSMLPRHTASLLEGLRWPAFPVGGAAVVGSAGIATQSLKRVAPRSGVAAGLRVFAMVTGVVCAAIGLLLGADLVSTYTCCPGYHGLASYFGLLIVAGLSISVAVVFVPITFAVLLGSTERSVTRNSTLVGLTAALLPSAVSLATAPRYYQDIGNWLSAAGSVLTVGLLVIGILALWHFRSSGWPLVLPLLPLAAVTLLMGSGVAWQSASLPSDSPATSVRATSRSIVLVAPTGHSEVVREVNSYQAEYNLLARRAGLPIDAATFVITFDSVSSRPTTLAAWQWPISMSLSQTPGQRLQQFRQAAAYALTYRFGLPAYEPYAAFEQWLLDPAAPTRSISEICQSQLAEAPFASAERNGGISAAQALMHQLSPGPFDPGRQPITDDQWLARTQAVCSSS